MKKNIVEKILKVLEKAVECSYESASMCGMYQRKEPKGVNEFIQWKGKNKEA